MQREQLLEPARRRPAGQEREEAVELALDERNAIRRADLPGGQRHREHAVDRQEGIENSRIRGEVGVRASSQIALDVTEYGVGEVLPRPEIATGQWLVDGRQFETVLALGDGPFHHLGEGRAAHVGRVENARELRPGQQGPLRVRAEQLPIVRGGQLLGHQRPDLVTEVGRATIGAQRRNRIDGEIPRRNRGRIGQGVPELGVVRHAAARPDVQHRLGPARVIPQLAVGGPFEPAAAALAEQHHQIDEGQPKTPDQHRLSRPEIREVDVGGVARRDIGEAMTLGGCRQPALLAGGLAVQETLGQHHHVRGQFRPVRQEHALSRGVLAHCNGRRSVLGDGDPIRQGRHRAVVGPAQIVRLDLPAGEVVGPQRGGLFTQTRCGQRGPALAGDPFRKGGPRPDGSGAGDRGVGEDRHVPRHRVHPQQLRLFRSPDPAPANGIGIDNVNVNPCRPRNLGHVGGQSFQDPHGARTTAHEDQGR